MRMLIGVLAIGFLSAVGSADADNFSCPFGKRGACLDYGDKVCGSFGKCVDDNAVCFASYTCDFRGFVCKSAFDEVVDDFNELVRKARTLASDYDRLVSDHNALIDEHNDLVDDYESLARKYRDATDARDEFAECVAFSSTLEEARLCE